jgi:hypothetical protein
MVTAVLGGRRRRGTVGERASEVLRLEHLAEPLRSPVRHQELEAGTVAKAAVAVVAEDRDDALPDLGHLLQRHPRAEALGEHRVGGQAATHPDVEARAEDRVLDADERDVVDLVRDVEAWGAGDGRLELAGQVGELGAADVLLEDLADRRRAVDDLVGRDARDRRPEDHAGRVAAGLRGGEPDRLETPPDLGHVLDANPVELDVLSVGDVGGVARELRADPGDRAQLLA